MEHGCAAERALVAAVVLGELDPAELSGRLRSSDFTDPAAGQLFEFVAAVQTRGRTPADLPRLLRRRGLLRSDGYPLSELMTWMRQLPTPVHPQAWGALVVANSLARQVQASGIRLQQSAESALESGGGAGQVLAMAEAQRAGLSAAARRWDDLPQTWRDSCRLIARIADSASAPAVESRRGTSTGAGRERELLAGLVAAPRLLVRMPWLEQSDFTDPACGSLFATLRRLHERGYPVDVITLATAASHVPTTGDGETPARVAASLRPEHTFPSAAPYLARQVLEVGIVTSAHDAGQDLARLASLPPAAGGLGAPRVVAAVERLERLRPHQHRLEAARRNRTGTRAEPSAGPATRLTPHAERGGTSLDRHAG